MRGLKLRGANLIVQGPGWSIDVNPYVQAELLSRHCARGHALRQDDGHWLRGRHDKSADHGESVSLPTLGRVEPLRAAHFDSPTHCNRAALGNIHAHWHDTV